MAYNRETKELAKQMFVSEGKTMEQIEIETDVPIGTLYRWRRQYKWDQYIRNGGQIGIALQVKKEFMEKLEEAIEQKKLTDPSTADALLKISKVVENLMPKAVMLSNIFALFESLVEYLINHTDPEFTAMFQKYMPSMSDYLRKKFSS